MISAKEARSMTNLAMRNLNMVLELIESNIMLKAAKGEEAIYLSAKELYIGGDRTHNECGIAYIARELESLGYETDYNHNGILISW